MSPDEVAFLKNWGQILLFAVVDSVVASVCYGATIVILLTALFTLFPPGFLRNWRSVAMFVVNIICLIVATGFFSGSAAADRLYLKSPLILSKYDSLDEGLYAVWKQMYVPETFPFWMNPFAVVTSDVVVIWRVWHLQSNHRWQKMAIPLILVVATALMLLLSNVYGLTFEEWYRTKSDPRGLGIVLGNIGDGLSLATNLATTILVGWRLWTERTIVTRYIRVQSSFSFAEKILVLLVEFGAIFCLLQFVSLLFTLMLEHGNVHSLTFRIITQCVYKFQRIFATVYPTLVIILVRTKNSVMDEVHFDSG